MSDSNARRGFFGKLAAAVGLTSMQGAAAQPASSGASDAGYIPKYARTQPHRSLKQSSYDTTGGMRTAG